MSDYVVRPASCDQIAQMIRRVRPLSRLNETAVAEGVAKVFAAYAEPRHSGINLEVNANPGRRQLISGARKPTQITGIGHHRSQPIRHHIAMGQSVVTAEHDNGLLDAGPAQLDPFFYKRHRKAPDFLFEGAGTGDGSVSVGIRFQDREQAGLGATDSTSQHIGIPSQGTQIDLGHRRANVSAYVEYLVDGRAP